MKEQPISVIKMA